MDYVLALAFILAVLVIYFPHSFKTYWQSPKISWVELILLLTILSIALPLLG
jgi:hypothetical protein